MEDQCKTVSLGWCVARLTVKNNVPAVMIMSPALFDSDQSEPASSVNIYGLEGIKALAKLLSHYA